MYYRITTYCSSRFICVKEESRIASDEGAGAQAATKGGLSDENLTILATSIKQWGKQLGFQQIGISDLSLDKHRQHYLEWLDKHQYGEMRYMYDQQDLRLNPDKLHPNTCRVISARMDYLPENVETVKLLNHKQKAYISRYALGRDYHKLIRKRLSQLADKIAEQAGTYTQRPFVDSAPVLERAFAEKAGLGWIGKNTMLINKQAGSWFFLGELFTDLPLPVDKPVTEKHCGSCRACLDICPTQAFNGEFELDARKCISYLTIEFKGSIPVKFRTAMGNRVFGCDDCQLVCPWNKFSQHTGENDFKPRHNLDQADLLTLFLWSEEEFDKNTQGSAIRRTGYECWLRNLAIGLGNGVKTDSVINGLRSRQNYSPLVAEHVEWALGQLGEYS